MLAHAAAAVPGVEIHQCLPVGVTDDIAAGRAPWCGKAGCHAPIIATRGDLVKGGLAARRGRQDGRTASGPASSMKSPAVRRESPAQFDGVMEPADATAPQNSQRRKRRRHDAPLWDANLRANGMRLLDVSCWQCHHEAVVSADPCADDVPVPTFGPRNPGWVQCGQRSPV